MCPRQFATLSSEVAALGHKIEHSTPAVGFDNGNSYSMLEYNSPDKRLGVDINVAGGLRNLYLTVISNNMDDNYWTAETDIAATDAATLASQGITATGLEKGATNASLDLSAIVARMHASESGAATVHKIILQARDEATTRRS